MQIFIHIGKSLPYITPWVSIRPAPYRDPSSTSRLVRPQAFAQKYAKFFFLWPGTSSAKKWDCRHFEVRNFVTKKVKVRSKKVPALRYRRHENIFFQYSKKKKINVAGRAHVYLSLFLFDLFDHFPMTSCS